MGEVMAPVLESPPPGGIRSGAGATPVWLLVLAALAVAGCNDTASPRATALAPAAPAIAAADPARGVRTELDGTAPAFEDGLLAELTGDRDGATAAFTRVLDAPDSPAQLAALSALHLARLAAIASKPRHALDLIARASALAPNDPTVTAGVAEVETEVVAAASGVTGASEIRGPRLYTPLPGVEPRVAAQFTAAEHALARVHQLRARVVIEALSSSIAVKEDATEDAVAKYRAVGEHGGLAQVAADYRIGSLYHDLALALLFELPPELDPAVAEGLRRTLRARAIGDLHRAVTAYRASIAGPTSPDAELWRLAAQTDLRGASDVLASAP